MRTSLARGDAIARHRAYLQVEGQKPWLQIGIIMGILKKLDRAHRMTGSDPEDPTCATLYSEAAAAIRAARSAADGPRTPSVDPEVIGRLRQYVTAKRAQVNAEDSGAHHDVLMMFNGISLRLGDIESLLEATATDADWKPDA